MALVLYALMRNPCLATCITPQRASSYSMTGHMFEPALSHAGSGPPAGQYQFRPATLDAGSLKGSHASLLNEVCTMWKCLCVSFLLPCLHEYIPVIP